MVKSYATIISRIMVVAMLIGMSANVQASEHGTMPKRHRMTCGQLCIAVLGLSAFVHQGVVTADVKECVAISAGIGDTRYFTKSAFPVCKTPDLTAAQAQGALSVALGVPLVDPSMVPTDCLTKTTIGSDAMANTMTQCLPLHSLGKEHIGWNTVRLQPKVASPVQQ